MRADVQGLMHGELGDWLGQQSAMRTEAKAEATSRWTWGAAGLLPVLAFLWFGPFFSGTFTFILTALAIGGVYAWGYMPIAEAKKAIKVGINSAIANSLGVQYAHDVEPGGEFEACRTYGLVPNYDRSDFEDRWFGRLEGHSFELYEAHLEERRGSNKNRRWVTVFRGAIIAMEFGRSFHSTTLLQRAGKHQKWLGLGGRKDNVKFKGHQLAYVDQVHPDFEDIFELWSDDQVEARVLVHPSYIEHLIALEKAFHGEAVRALFTRGSVVIAVESQDLFESGSLDAEGDEARVAEAAAQFEALAGLALAINQNERGRVLQNVERDPIGGQFGRRRRNVRR
ncbi:DUF3137 domain-containing protein [Erythrobacter insulae]|uniref:DUF3137 domain-containing protein n=2 Tax=Erythrobacter insulae TaxID=2584124 RepID=A0A547P7J9_9SPHN|nr:DUF3137 domain-containing protein [Erythrobacter insulae]